MPEIVFEISEDDRDGGTSGAPGPGVTKQARDRAGEIKVERLATA